MIKKNFVLTAAHCVCWVGFNKCVSPDTITVWAGGTSLSLSTYEGMESQVIGVYPHENFVNKKKAYYDIALIEVIIC